SLAAVAAAKARPTDPTSAEATAAKATVMAEHVLDALKQELATRDTGRRRRRLAKKAREAAAHRRRSICRRICGGRAESWTIPRRGPVSRSVLRSRRILGRS